MCGITAGVSEREITPLLLESLKRLEYRGYDSAGLALITPQGKLNRLRVCGKVDELKKQVQTHPLNGNIGIAHTRWATHGKPSESNAHPHFFEDSLALVHNGIIENYKPLRLALENAGIKFSSETDTEVIVQHIGLLLKENGDLLSALRNTLAVLKGAYALAIVSKLHPDCILAARSGSPLVIGLGHNENFIASDSLALLPFTQDFIALEEGDIACVYRTHYQIYNKEGQPVERSIRKVQLSLQSTDRGQYRHYMQKEIFEQPQAIRSALGGRLQENTLSEKIFGENAERYLNSVKAIQIVGCGTSFHAGLVAKYWLEQLLGIPCQVEIASEMRYQRIVTAKDTLLIALSQSGETADTLAAFKNASSPFYCGKLAICNVAESALTRLSDLTLLTQAGPEIGVASTKAFITQLISLLMLVQILGQKAEPNIMAEHQITQTLRNLPFLMEAILSLDAKVAQIATKFADKQNALFIGRGIYYPIAREGALKLKEISYIHAEAYPAGELKHGPLALVDKHMPVIVLAPNDERLDKLSSNLQEVSARGGELIVLTQEGTNLELENVIEIPAMPALATPFAFTVLLQLLAYHVAVLKGTDVDQPRNLAKSVTVE